MRRVVHLSVSLSWSILVFVLLLSCFSLPSVSRHFSVDASVLGPLHSRLVWCVALLFRRVGRVLSTPCVAPLSPPVRTPHPIIGVLIFTCGSPYLLLFDLEGVVDPMGKPDTEIALPKEDKNNFGTHHMHSSLSLSVSLLHELFVVYLPSPLRSLSFSSQKKTFAVVEG